MTINCEYFITGGSTYRSAIALCLESVEVVGSEVVVRYSLENSSILGGGFYPGAIVYATIDGTKKTRDFSNGIGFVDQGKRNYEFRFAKPEPGDYTVCIGFDYLTA